MATATTSDVTIQEIGRHLRDARADIQDLKTHVMGMGDRINGLESRMNQRFDGIDGQLLKIIDHLGIE